jgi:scyllo-inositol 2-dehydrogenase (NADP+)
MTPQLRVALLGYGLAGRVFHAPLIQAEPWLRLDAVVTGHPERAERVRREHPDASVVETASDIWDAAEDYDLVVVATANVAHREQAEAALRHGLHVVVDKPLAGDAEAAIELFELADRHDRQLHVFQNRRWDSDFRTLRFLLEDGRLGHVHRLESRFERWRPELDGAWRESSDPSQLGGLLLDLGSHLVDQALQLLGPVDTVYAEMGRRRDPDGPEDDVFVALGHHSGAVSHLWASALAARPGPRFRVLGSRGGYVVEGLDSQEDRLQAGHRPDEPGWGEEPAEQWGRVYPGGAVVPTIPGAWPEYYQRVAACIRGHSPPPVEPHTVVDALRVLDAARVSAASREVVPVPPTSSGR